MINVVAAIIIDNNKIFIAERNKNKSQGGLWEFPGGKIESGETKEQALIREIKEELDMDIIVKEEFTNIVYNYPDKTINLTALICQKTSNNYKLLEHESFAWVTLDELNNYEFAPADILIVDKILKNLKN